MWRIVQERDGDGSPGVVGQRGEFTREEIGGGEGSQWWLIEEREDRLGDRE